MTPQFWVGVEQTKTIINKVLGEKSLISNYKEASSGSGWGKLRMCAEARARRDATAKRLEGNEWYTSHEIAAWGLHPSAQAVKDDVRRMSGLESKYVKVGGRTRSVYRTAVTV